MSAAEADTGTVNDVRPVIPTGSQGNWGMWALGAVLLLGGVMLFNALSASSETTDVPNVLIPVDRTGGRIASPPPLRTPDRFETAAPLAERAEPTPDYSVQRNPPPYVPQAFQPFTPAPFSPRLPEPLPAPSVEPLRLEPPQVVFNAPPQASASNAASQGEDEVERVTASRLRNPSRTIPQGTVIPAVLETALDSTRPGGVRALVQRDVSSFDGSRVLIPRGSRLYGEYQADLQSGQNRALVQWTRLIRPDGVTIALNSPSSDPLGRAGVQGRVDTKFFQRFGGALLQSVLDIGVGLAVNEASDGVFVALPGSTQNVQIAEPQRIQPTLKVRHGASVSVFVARDLDFSSVDP